MLLKISKLHGNFKRRGLFLENLLRIEYDKTSTNHQAQTYFPNKNSNGISNLVFHEAAE
jgi:hypothetical protein